MIFFCWGGYQIKIECAIAIYLMNGEIFENLLNHAEFSEQAERMLADIIHADVSCPMAAWKALLQAPPPLPPIEWIIDSNHAQSFAYALIQCDNAPLAIAMAFEHNRRELGLVMINGQNYVSVMNAAIRAGYVRAVKNMYPLGKGHSYKINICVPGYQEIIEFFPSHVFVPAMEHRRWELMEYGIALGYELSGLDLMAAVQTGDIKLVKFIVGIRPKGEWGKCAYVVDVAKGLGFDEMTLYLKEALGARRPYKRINYATRGVLGECKPRQR